MNYITSFVNVVEMLGTVAFAVSGAQVAIKKKMDILGIVVLANVTAVGGGTIRDILLGNTPPSAFRNPVYVIWATVTALILFVLAEFRWTEEVKKIFDQYVNVIDALGLGLFAVIGVRTAIASGYGENAFLSVFVGVLTAVGGGILRDTMAGEVPSVFRKRIYALAALAGAWIYYMIADKLVSSSAAMIIGGAVVVIIRSLASHYKWDLPKAKYDITFHAQEENKDSQETGEKSI
jgi:uncharacterized membrane protein YeiH